MVFTSSKPFLPYLKNCVLRLLLILVVVHECSRSLIDVRNAFVNSLLKGNIHVRQPEVYRDEGKKEFVSTQDIAPHGLRKALGEWNLYLDMLLITMKCKKSDTDPALYLSYMEGSFMFLIVYADNNARIGNLQSAAGEMTHNFEESFEARVSQRSEKILVIAVDDKSSNLIDRERLW